MAVQKDDTAIAKQCSCSNVEFPYFAMGSHLSQWPHSVYISSTGSSENICSSSGGAYEEGKTDEN
jgi:hypothetical protein